MEASVHHLVLKVTPLVWARAAQAELAAADIWILSWNWLEQVRGRTFHSGHYQSFISQRYPVAVCKFVFGHVVMAPALMMTQLKVRKMWGRQRTQRGIKDGIKRNVELGEDRKICTEINCNRAGSFRKVQRIRMRHFSADQLMQMCRLIWTGVEWCEWDAVCTRTKQWNGKLLLFLPATLFVFLFLPVFFFFFSYLRISWNKNILDWSAVFAKAVLIINLKH